jgi:hypothetical protein
MARRNDNVSSFSKMRARNSAVGERLRFGVTGLPEPLTVAVGGDPGGRRGGGHARVAQITDRDGLSCAEAKKGSPTRP